MSVWKSKEKSYNTPKAKGTYPWKYLKDNKFDVIQNIGDECLCFCFIFTQTIVEVTGTSRKLTIKTTNKHNKYILTHVKATGSKAIIKLEK